MSLSEKYEKFKIFSPDSLCLRVTVFFCVLFFVPRIGQKARKKTKHVRKQNSGRRKTRHETKNFNEKKIFLPSCIPNMHALEKKNKMFVTNIGFSTEKNAIQDSFEESGPNEHWVSLFPLRIWVVSFFLWQPFRRCFPRKKRFTAALGTRTLVAKT